MASGLYFFPLVFLGSSVAEVQGEAIIEMQNKNTRNVTILLPGDYITCIVCYCLHANLIDNLQTEEASKPCTERN